MLNLIGLGLGNEKDITLNALDAVKRSDKIYLENYTSKLQCNIYEMEKLYGKKIILATRELVEKQAEDTILKDAKKYETSFLVIGDIFGATTHIDLVLRAKKAGIGLRYFHNASIMNAIGITGLELYKFGKTTSMPFFEKGWKPSTAYDIIVMNKNNGLHTLILLDIKQAEPSKDDIRKGINKPMPPRYMTVNECLSQLFEIENERKKGIITDDTKVVACARIGSQDALIKYGKVKDILKMSFGKELHCLIVPGDMHFIEEEFLKGI